MSYKYYWEENNLKPGEITPAQISWLKKYTNYPEYLLLGLSRKEATEEIGRIITERRKVGLTVNDF